MAVGLLLLLSGCSAVDVRADAPVDDASTPPATRSSPPVTGTSPEPSRQSPSPSGTAGRLRSDGGWGPSAQQISRSRRIVSRMTLEQLAGQVIVAGYDGTAAPSALVNDLHLGGVIVMAENITGPDRLRRSNRELQRAAAEAGRRWPVFIGVDQEGGRVERVQHGTTRFPAFMTTGAARDRKLTRRAAAASGAELADLNFTVVFAPDADVTSGPDDPTIGSRSAGSSARRVSNQVSAAVGGYGAAGIVPVVKHFPGHGSVNADSHLELPVQRASLRTLRARDLVPFRSAVDAGVPAVMVAHIDLRALDPGTPASLSRAAVTGLLRRDLGFRGLVVTDALNMRAVSDRFSSATAAVRALRAGGDVLLMPADARSARDGVVRAVRSDRLPRARVEQAAARQIAVLLHQKGTDAEVEREPGSSGRISRRLSAAGVTVVSGPCRGRLVGPSVRVTGPRDVANRFRASARRAGLGTGSGTTVALLGPGDRPRNADVVVSTDTPYVLGSSRARTARIAVYGETPGAMHALVRVLLGRAEAPGRLPVPVPGVRRHGC